MPPQISKTGSGTATQQPSISGEQKDTKSTSSSTATNATESASRATASEPQAQSQKAQEDPKTAARSHKSSQRHATEKRSQQTMHGQMLQKDLQKKVGKQQPDGLWESMKNVASVAVESFDKTARAIDRATADTAMIDAAQKANAHIMEGLKITRQQQAKTIAAEANRAAFGPPNPEFKERMKHPLATPELLAEGGIYANLKPKFEDSEKVIQKMDEYNRQSSPNDYPPTNISNQVNARSMEKLLGPYGYYTTNIPDPWVRKEILDAALHNWRNTPPEARQALHARDKDSPALHGDYTKNWKTPPRTSFSEEERIERSQVVQDPPLPGAYMRPGHQGPRGDRPDPGEVFAKGAYDFRNAGFDVINSMGGGLPAEGRATVEPSNTGRANVTQTYKPVPTDTQPGGPLAPNVSPQPSSTSATKTNTKPQAAESGGTQTNAAKAADTGKLNKDLAEPAKGSEVKRNETPDVNRMETPRITVEEAKRQQRALESELERHKIGARDFVEAQLGAKAKAGQLLLGDTRSVSAGTLRDKLAEVLGRELGLPKLRNRPASEVRDIARKIANEEPAALTETARKALDLLDALVETGKRLDDVNKVTRGAK